MSPDLGAHNFTSIRNARRCLPNPAALFSKPLDPSHNPSDAAAHGATVDCLYFTDPFFQKVIRQL